MVDFELIEKNDKQLVYHYFPEGKRDSRPGIIVYDMAGENLSVRDKAEADIMQVVDADELNMLAKAINDMKKACGETDLCEMVTESESYPVYADHALRRIRDELNKGIVPEKGTVMWY